jgi:hypothetical protein
MAEREPFNQSTDIVRQGVKLFIRDHQNVALGLQLTHFERSVAASSAFTSSPFNLM